ncbi:hypothetical protein M2H09_20895 [Vibrio vulnificus]|nr:hypothetical protein [Vibrio vulnificus]
MRLSHRKKVASKHGIYWPSRTKQQRLVKEAMTRAELNTAQISVQIGIVSAAFDKACKGISKAAGIMALTLKAMFQQPNSDASQREGIYD